MQSSKLRAPVAELLGAWRACRQRRREEFDTRAGDGGRTLVIAIYNLARA
jgi:hypothetical protein